MSTPIKGNTANELANRLRGLASTYEYSGRILNETVETIKPLKNIVGENSVEAKAKDSRLITAGIALIAFPDPTITDAIGAAMVAAGLLKSKMRKPAAADACEELRKAVMKIGNLKHDIVINK